MGNFSFRNEETGEVITEWFNSHKDVPKFVKKDGARFYRCVAAEIASQGGMSTNAWPMSSTALKIAKHQVKEYTEFCAKNGVPIEYDKRNRPIFTGQKHRRDYFRLVGVKDLDGSYGDNT